MIEATPNSSASSREATIDVEASIGIGMALNTLRIIAAGSGFLRREGEGLVGYCIEDGQKIDIYISKENFYFSNQPLLTPDGMKPNERLQEVSSRLFELAGVAVAGKSPADLDFSILAEEICGYLHDQEQIAVEFIALEKEAFGKPASRERPRIDHEALIRELTPRLKIETEITEGAVMALRKAFAANSSEVQRIVETLEERYQLHLRADRSAESRWGSYYLGYARNVESLGDMQRFSHYHSRQKLVSQMFSLYCESYAPEFAHQKDMLSAALARIIVFEATEAEDIQKIVATPTLLEKTALAELSLEAFKLLSKNYVESHYGKKPLHIITHNLYWHPLEGCSGIYRLDEAIKEGRAIIATLRTQPRLSAFENHAFDRYLHTKDLSEIKTAGITALRGNKWARSYRNACIEAVETIEKIRPEHFIYLHRDARALPGGSTIEFSRFIDEEWQRRKGSVVF